MTKQEYNLSVPVFSLSLHESSTSVVCGLIDGRIVSYDYSTSGESPVVSLQAHKKSIRGLSYSQDGDYIISVSSDKSIRVHSLSTSKCLFKKLKAHKSCLNALKVLDGNSLVTGDEDGVIKVWDTRTRNAVREYGESHQDYISDFDYVEDKKTVLSGSGDGSLGVFDLRMKKPVAMSEDQEMEIKSVRITKAGKKIVVGGDMAIGVFSWNEFQDCSDRIPTPVECLDLVDQNRIIAGGCDGKLSMLGIHPNCVIKDLGEHEQMERICVRGEMAASCGLDGYVRIWDLTTQVKSKKEFFMGID